MVTSLSDNSPKLNGVQRLLEAGLLVSCVFAMFIMMALFSFDPADPGWSQTGYQTPIRNLGGAVGASLSDLLLNLFGIISYSLPFVISIIGWLLFQKHHRLIQLDYLTLGLKFIGFLMFYIGITSIASMNFDDIFYFSAGGILGDVLSNSLIPYFSFVGSTLLFLTFCSTGFVLLTGISLLKFIDDVGKYSISFIQYLATLPRSISAKFGTKEKTEQVTDIVPDNSKLPEVEETSNLIAKSSLIESKDTDQLDVQNAFSSIKPTSE